MLSLAILGLGIGGMIVYWLVDRAVKNKSADAKVNPKKENAAGSVRLVFFLLNAKAILLIIFVILVGNWSAMQHPATAALRAFSVLRAALLFAAAVAALLLAFDPRYRDFPLWLYALPSLYAGIAAWWLADNGREERICAAVIAAAALLSVRCV